MSEFNLDELRLESFNNSYDISYRVMKFARNFENPNLTKEKRAEILQSLLTLWKEDFRKNGLDFSSSTPLSKETEERALLLEYKLDIVIKALYEQLGQEEEKLSLLESFLPLKKETKNVREKRKIVTIDLKTPEPSTLSIVNLSQFNPHGIPGKKIDLRNTGFAGILASQYRLNFGSTLSLDDPKTSDKNEGIGLIARYLEKEYFTPKNKALHEVLRQAELKGVEDIQQLTPRQAILLANSIAIERLKYSMEQVKLNKDSILYGTNTESEINDKVPIHQLFEWGNKDREGNAVCRNFASVVVGVLEGLKMIQDPKNSQIHNVYGLELMDKNPMSSRKNVPGEVKMHAWNGFISIDEKTTQGYDIQGIITDATWASSSSRSLDPARSGNLQSKLDYTKERYFTLLRPFEERGIISEEQYIYQLIKTYKNTPKILTESTGDITSEPERILLGYKVLDMIQKIRFPEKIQQTILENFLKEFLEDMTKYGALLRLENSRKGMTDDFFNYLYIYTTVTNEKGIFIEGRDEIITELYELGKDGYKTLDAKILYMMLFARLGNKEKFLEELYIFKGEFKKYSININDVTDKLLVGYNATFILSDEYIQILEKELEIKLKETEVERIKYLYNVRVITREKNKTILPLVEKYLRTHKNPSTLYFSILNFQEKKEPTFSVGKGFFLDSNYVSIELDENITEDKFEKVMTEFSEFEDALIKIQQRYPVKIDVNKGIAQSKRKQFIKNIQTTLASLPLTLLMYRNIILDFEDNVEGKRDENYRIPFVHPKIKAERFLVKNFGPKQIEEIRELLSRNRLDEKETQASLLTLQKDFEALRQRYPFVKSLSISDKSKNISTLREYLVALEIRLEQFKRNSDNQILREKGFSIRLTSGTQELLDGERELYKKGYPTSFISLLDYGLRDLRKGQTRYGIESIIAPNGEVLKVFDLKKIFASQRILKKFSFTIGEGKYPDEKKESDRKLLREAINRGEVIVLTKIDEKGKGYYKDVPVFLLPGDKIVFPKSQITGAGLFTTEDRNEPELFISELDEKMKLYKEVLKAKEEATKLFPYGIKISIYYDFSEISYETLEAFKEFIKVFSPAEKNDYLRGVYEVRINVGVRDKHVCRVEIEKDGRRFYESDDYDLLKPDTFANFKSYVEFIIENEKKIAELEQRYRLKVDYRGMEGIKKIAEYIKILSEYPNLARFEGYNVYFSRKWDLVGYADQLSDVTKNIQERVSPSGEKGLYISVD